MDTYQSHQTPVERVNAALAYSLAMSHTRRHHNIDLTELKNLLLHPDVPENALEIVLAPNPQGEYEHRGVSDFLAEINPGYKTKHTTLVLHLPFEIRYTPQTQEFNSITIESDYNRGFVHLALGRALWHQQNSQFKFGFKHNDIITARVVKVTDSDYTPVIKYEGGMTRGIIPAPTLLDHMLAANHFHPFYDKVECTDSAILELASQLQHGFDGGQLGHFKMRADEDYVSLFGVIAAPGPSSTESGSASSSIKLYRFSEAGFKLHRVWIENLVPQGVTVHDIPSLATAYGILNFRRQGGWGIEPLVEREAIQAIKDGVRRPTSF